MQDWRDINDLLQLKANYKIGADGAASLRRRLFYAYVEDWENLAKVWAAHVTCVTYTIID